MAGEIRVYTEYPGETVYALIKSPNTGNVWNGTAFEAFNAANWNTYDIPLVEQSAGFYLGDMPSNVVAGVYEGEAYLQDGVSPASDDELIAVGIIRWNVPDTTPSPVGPCDEGGIISTEDFLLAASKAQSITVDGQVVEKRPISDLIALDKHLATRRSSCAMSGNGWGMVAKARVVPPSAVGEDRV